MIPITKLVERLRDDAVICDASPSTAKLIEEAASKLETLWAEVEAWRNYAVMREDGPDMCVVKELEQARRATDAELGRGGE